MGSMTTSPWQVGGSNWADADDWIDSIPKIGLSSPGATTTSSWKGGSGNWTTKTDWTNGVPDGGNADADLVAEATAFTVTSSANVQLDFLTVGASVTLSLTGGTFSMDSTANLYSATYNYGTINVGSGATFALGNSVLGDSAEIYGPGTVNVATGGKMLLNSPWTGLMGGKVVFAGGIVSAVGTQQGFENDAAVISGYGEIVSALEAVGPGSDSVTIAGKTITVGTNVILTNAYQGTIDATGATGDYLLLFTGFAQIENDGLLETTGAGGLYIASTLNQNGSLVAAGTGALTIIDAEVDGGGSETIDAGASIVLDNGQLSTGGELDIAAKGVLTNTSGDLGAIGTNGNYFGDVLNTTIFSSGAIEVQANSVLNLETTLYNQGAGALDLDGVKGGEATLEFFAGGTIDGGEIVLSAGGYNLIDSNGAGQQFSNNSDLLGAGTIGDGWLRLYNGVTGVIDANAAAGMKIVEDTNAFNNNSENFNYNAGIIETTGAGVLTFEAGGFLNGGTIDAAGGAITFQGAQDTNGGGLVETTGSGKIVLADGSVIEDNDYVSISSGGALTTSAGDTGAKADSIFESVFDSGTIAVVADSVLMLDGHWNDTGNITLGKAGLGGGATIEIATNQSWSLFGGTLELLNAADVITGAGPGTQLRFRGLTVVGAGTLGDDNMTVDNQGTSILDATGVMNILATNNTQNTQLNNAGLMEATGDGALTLEAATFNTGKLLAAASSSITADNQVYGNGVVEIQGSGVATFDNELDNDVIFGSTTGGELKLGSATQFYGNIDGFAAGDSIDLVGFVRNSSKLNLNFGTLGGSIEIGGTLGGNSVVVGLNFVGNYAADSSLWSATSDGHGGTLVKL